MGLTAQGVIDIQSNSTFFRKICIHSNAHVSVNSGNSFAAGTTVSMPDTDDLVLPSSGLSQNPGLADALLEDEIDIRLLRRITATAADPLEQAILTPEDPDRPDYLTSTAVRNLGTGGSVSYLPSDFGAGQVHRRTCSSSGGTITLSGGVYSRFVLLTNCQIQISGKVDLQNVVLFTTNTDPTSVKVNSGGGSETGLWLGRPDNCQPGGAAQIITRGGFRNSAKLTIDGGQIVALGDVNFSAQATGLGASIVAGGRIDGSSNLSFSGCDIGRGTGENFAGLYIRIVR